MNYKLAFLLPASLSLSALACFFMWFLERSVMYFVVFSFYFLMAVLYWVSWFNYRAAAKAVSNQEVVDDRY